MADSMRNTKFNNCSNSKLKYNKILLIAPDYEKSRYGAYRPPAGLGYLSEALIQNEVAHEVIDMGLGYDYQYLKKYVDDYKPDLIGLSFMSIGYPGTYRLIKRIKDDFPEITICCGGPHISVLRETALEECPAIDYGFFMEGEESFLEFISGRSPIETNGLLFRKNGKVVSSGERPFITDLDAVPFPKYEKFELEKYILKEISIITSRGCPARCIFCPVNLVIGKRMRFRSPVSVVDEIEYWLKRGYQFYIADDNFTLKKDRVMKICDELAQRDLITANMKCLNGVRADKVDKELLTRMKEVGFTTLAFGVESGSERILKTIQKGETLREIQAAVQIACDLGYDVTLFFIVGSPGETLEDVKKSIKFAESFSIADVRFYNLIPFPRTKLYEWTAKEDYLLYEMQDYLGDLSAWSDIPVFETPEFSKEDRKKAFEMCSRARKNILRKNIERKLSKFGFLSRLGGYIFINDKVQHLLLNNRMIRRLAERAYQYVN
jgi:radical SAM superfamily enzyme YgiQ (UPF0313 family)